jgi:hypothetical protein
MDAQVDPLTEALRNTTLLLKIGNCESWSGQRWEGAIVKAPALVESPSAT